MLACILWYLDPLLSSTKKKKMSKLDPPLAKLSGSVHVSVLVWSNSGHCGSEDRAQTRRFHRIL